MEIVTINGKSAKLNRDEQKVAQRLSVLMRKGDTISGAVTDWLQSAPNDSTRSRRSEAAKRFGFLPTN